MISYKKLPYIKIIVHQIHYNFIGKNSDILLGTFTRIYNKSIGISLSVAQFKYLYTVFVGLHR